MSDEQLATMARELTAARIDAHERRLWHGGSYSDFLEAKEAADAFFNGPWADRYRGRALP